MAHHPYLPSVTQFNSCLVCHAPRQAPDHPHRYEPTLADPGICMCGGRADAEQHQPTGTTGRDQEPTAAQRLHELLGVPLDVLEFLAGINPDGGPTPTAAPEAQRDTPPLLPTRPVRITTRTPELEPAPFRPGAGARLRTALRTHFRRGR